jgi:thermitase
MLASAFSTWQTETHAETPVGSASTRKPQNINARSLSARSLIDSNATDLENPRGWGLYRNESLQDDLDADGSVRLVVGTNPSKSKEQELMKIISSEAGNVTGVISIGKNALALAVKVLPDRVSFLVDKLRASGLVEYVERDSRVEAFYFPNDPDWTYQWGPKKIEADLAWDTTIGSSDILVAIVDTGVDYTHSDLAANYVPLGYDWINNDTDPIDDFGHGTHCAGIVAATLNNSIGIAGVAQVRIMAEKVLGSSGWGTDFTVAEGIVHATDSGAKIISMSLGGGGSDLMHDAVKYAHDHGVLLVASAGNKASSEKHYPAAYDEVIAVSATDSGDNLASFSSYGEWIDVAAPGVDIYSTMPTYHVTMNDIEYGLEMNYDYMSGTSMACPHVAGVAALAWSVYPNCTADQVMRVLEYTADDLGDSGFDEYYGQGRVNARKTVNLPEHDLRITKWQRPRRVDPRQSCEFNATIANSGRKDEANVSVRFLVNGTLIDNVIIDSMSAIGDPETVSFSWNTSLMGNYNVTCYVVPVLGEDSTENNVVHTNTMVRFPGTLTVPSDYLTIEAAVDVAGEGDAISVDYGYYSEDRIDILTDNITLTAIGYAVIDSRAGISDLLNVRANFVTIDGFTILNSEACGVKMKGHGNTLMNCNISDNRESIYIYDSTECTITLNDIDAHGGGIYIVSCTNCTITQNVLVTTSIDGGIHITDSSSNTISLNTITGKKGEGVFTVGLWVYYSQANLITSNNITGHWIGVQVGGSYGNLFFHNDFIDNLQYWSFFESVNTWDNGYPSGGNYWSDYAGQDYYSGPYQNETGCDGIGDTPRIIDASNVDHYPLLVPYPCPNNVPEHDLSVARWQHPKRLDPGQLGVFKATVFNNGRNNETGISVQFFINETMVDSATIDLLEACASKTVSFSWRSTATGRYKATCYVVPVPDENLTKKNVASSNVIVRFPITLHVPDDCSTIRAALASAGEGDTLSVDAGYYVENCIDVLTDNITLSANGCVVLEGSGAGYVLNVLANFVIIDGFTILNSDVYGVKMNGHGNTLTNCNISHNRENIYIYGSSGCTVVLNYVDSHSGGMYVDGCTNCTITQNVLVTTSFNGGMHITDSSSNTISLNTIIGKAFEGYLYTMGLWIVNSQTNLVTRNNITGHSDGLEVGGSYGNVFFHNDFIDNFRYYSDASVNTWDNGYPSGGNYWSDYIGREDYYRGPDQNKPGRDFVADTPYTIDPDNIDHYPLMNPYTNIEISGSDKQKTIVAEGYNLNVSIRITNYGFQSETFKVTVRANEVEIHTQTVTVEPKTTITMLFTWETQGLYMGTYNVTAVADRAPGEADTSDNVWTGFMKITIPGDLNGDFNVGPADFALLSSAYGSTPSKPKWNPNADINNDNRVGPADFALMSAHYG